MSFQRAFNSAAQNPEDYVFNLDQEVERFYGEFPEQEYRLYFIEASEMRVVRSGKDREMVRGMLSANTSLLELVEKTQADGTCTAARYTHYDCAVVNAAAPRKGKALAPAALREAYHLFALDHEIAHLTIPDGYLTATPNISECIADAYATLRHIQRFGAGTSLPAEIAALRAVELVFRDDKGAHFTSPVIQKIIADSAKTNFSAFTPEETMRLARRYALNNAAAPQLIRHLRETFKGFVGKLPELAAGDFTALRRLGQEMLSTEAGAIFKWSAAALRPLLAGKVSQEGKQILPAGEEWNKLKAALEHRQRQYNVQGDVFFGLGADFMAAKDRWKAPLVYPSVTGTGLSLTPSMMGALVSTAPAATFAAP